jgi:hypothetical protein
VDDLDLDLDRKNFLAWMKSAKPGAIIVYFTGDLARARDSDGQLDGLARAALRAADTGQVHLTQRRLWGGRYEYRATITRSETPDDPPKRTEP